MVRFHPLAHATHEHAGLLSFHVDICFESLFGGGFACVGRERVKALEGLAR